MRHLYVAAGLVVAAVSLLAGPVAGADYLRPPALISSALSARAMSASDDTVAAQAPITTQPQTIMAISRATPTALAEVKAAAGRGPRAVSALISRLENSAPAAATAGAMATTPSEYALGLALEASASGASTFSGNTSLGTRTMKAAFTNARKSCWHVGSHVANRWTFTEAGKPVAWIEKDHNYWCGNSYRITQNGLGFYHRQWQQFPFCLNITSDLHGWDGAHSSWAHGGIWASQGLWTPWGTCGTYQSGHAVLRIAAKGHFDYYNDY